MRTGSDRFERALGWLALPGIAVVLVRLFEAVAVAPLKPFNAARVAASVAMARGYPILTGPDDGPALDFMYGPVAALAYLPAAGSPAPTGAIWVGVVLAFLFVLAPVAWLVCARGSALPWPLRVLAGACFGIWCVHDPALRLAAFNIHADAAAIGLAGAACVAVLTSRGQPSIGRLIAGAAFAVLAVWTKQTAVLIVLALPLLVWLRDGRRAALRSAVCLAAVGVAVSLSFVAWFGLEPIVYTMFQIPGGHPWKPADPQDWLRVLIRGGRSQTLADLLGALLRSAGRLAIAAAPSAVLALAVAVAIGRGAAGTRGPLRREPALALALVGVAVAPMAALGGAKLGGDVNAYAMTTWFFAAAAVVGLLDLAGATARRTRRIACAALAGAVVLAVANELRAERRVAFAHAVEQVRDWRANRIERAAAFARAHPDQVFFATNPLIGLYADGVLYHSTSGLGDRTIAGLEVSDALRRRHLPARMRFLVVERTGGLGLTAGPSPGFPTFTVPWPSDDLPEYRVWTTRPGAAQP